MELKDAITQAEKLLAAAKKRPPTTKEAEAIKRLVEHAATSAAT